MELISIIVPVYNCKEYLKECVNSLLKQTYNNIEVFLVDDGSTDGSGKICDELAKTDKRIIVLHKKNGGVSSARNAAIKEIKGKYTLFVDSDDYVDVDYVDTLVNNIESNDMVVCGYVEEYKKKSIEMKITDENIIIDPKKANRLIYENRAFGGYLWNKLFITEIIQEKKIQFNEKIHMCEDQLFIINYLLYVKKINVISKMLYHYRMRKSSMVWKKNDRKIKTFYDAQLLIKEIYEKNNIVNEMFYFNLCNYIFINDNWKKNNILNDKYGITIYDMYKKIIKSNSISFKKKLRLFILRNFRPVYALYMKCKTKKLIRFD